MKSEEELYSPGQKQFTTLPPLKKPIIIQKFSHNPSIEIPFNKEDKQQNYYRQSLRIHEKNDYLTKYGWKIIELQRDEQDLTLQCCKYFESQFMFSVDFFINTIPPPQDQDQIIPLIRCLWMEVSLHRTGQSHHFNPNDRSSQISKIFQIYEQNLLPKLVSFITNYIKWDEITKKDLKQSEILNAFQQEVIDKMNELIEKQMKEAH